MATLFFLMAFVNTVMDTLKDTLVITAVGGGTQVIPFITGGWRRGAWPRLRWGSEWSARVAMALGPRPAWHAPCISTLRAASPTVSPHPNPSQSMACCRPPLPSSSPFRGAPSDWRAATCSTSPSPASSASWAGGYEPVFWDPGSSQRLWARRRRPGAAWTPPSHDAPPPPQLPTPAPAQIQMPLCLARMHGSTASAPPPLRPPPHTHTTAPRKPLPPPRFALFYPVHESLHLGPLAAWLGPRLPLGLAGGVGMLRNWMFTLFYCASELWGDVCLSLLFWGLANETTSMAEAPVLYPLFGIGANIAQTLAGRTMRLAFSGAARARAGYAARLQAMLGLCCGLCLAIMALQSWIAARFRASHAPPPPAGARAVATFEDPAPGDSSSDEEGGAGAGGGSPAAMSLGQAWHFLRQSPQIRCLALLAISQVCVFEEGGKGGAGTARESGQGVRLIAWAGVEEGRKWVGLTGRCCTIARLPSARHLRLMP